MVLLKPRQPRADGVAIVSAPTIKEAMRQVKARYGPEARVIKSRSVNRRQDGRLGRERMVEILVDAQGTGGDAATVAAIYGPRGRLVESDLRVDDEPVAAPALQRITREVERIEELVVTLAAEQRQLSGGQAAPLDNPLAEQLVERGTTPATMAHLITRFVSETGKPAGDRDGLLAYLVDSVRTATGGWESLAGCHVFLGGAGSGKTELVLAAAARLQAADNATLVLSLLPRHGGDVRRLQIEAAQHGYDAAILRKEEQLAGVAEHLHRYDVVLVDTPGLCQDAVWGGSDLPDQIGQDPGFHRHLVVPLDVDLQDCGPIWDAGRRWNCDWLALARLDCTRRPGKILDLVHTLPLPLSFLNEGSPPRCRPRVASSSDLVELLLDGRINGQARTPARQATEV